MGLGEEARRLWMDPRYGQILSFLKKTGEDLRAETQKLIDDLNNPEKQQRVREGLRELASWAKQTVGEVSERVEGVVRKAEGAITEGAGRVGVKVPPVVGRVRVRGRG